MSRNDEQRQLCGAEGEGEGAASPTEPVATAEASVFPSGNVNGDGFDDDDDALRSDAERSAMKATILKVAINLTNEGLLGAREANVVNDMINRENPVLVAAFKVRRKKIRTIAASQGGHDARSTSSPFIVSWDSMLDSVAQQSPIALSLGVKAHLWNLLVGVFTSTIAVG